MFYPFNCWKHDGCVFSLKTLCAASVCEIVDDGQAFLHRQWSKWTILSSVGICVVQCYRVILNLDLWLLVCSPYTQSINLEQWTRNVHHYFRITCMMIVLRLLDTDENLPPIYKTMYIYIYTSAPQKDYPLILHFFYSLTTQFFSLYSSAIAAFH